jgi:16S rRNA pseudouridine516 synthase
VERIDKLLANLGYCSRRQAAEFICLQHVTIDNRRIKDSALKVNPNGVQIDGFALDHPDGIFVLFNKPAGYVCSHNSAEGKLIYELLPAQWMKRNPVPSTIGRLDKDTTGVILITDRTQINHWLSSPHSNIEKVYQVTLDKPMSSGCVEAFSSGSILLPGESKPCLPALLRKTGDLTAEVTLSEGRYHQVKLMFKQCGYTVIALHRSKFGIYTAEGVDEGKYIELEIKTESE